MDFNTTEQLIHAIRKRPILYFPNHPDKKNNLRKLKAWMDIVKEVDVDSVASAKAKWKNLKDTYKKYKQSLSSTSSQSANKLNNWEWAGQMQFMDSALAMKSQEGCARVVKDETSDVSDSTSDASQSADGGDEKAASVNNEVPVDGGKRKCTEDEAEVSRKRRNGKMDPVDRIIEYFESRQDNPPTIQIPCDTTDMMFLGFSSVFKKLSRRLQATVRFEVAKVMLQAELQDLDDEMTAANNNNNRQCA